MYPISLWLYYFCGFYIICAIFQVQYLFEKRSLLEMKQFILRSWNLVYVSICKFEEQAYYVLRTVIIFLAKLRTKTRPAGFEGF